MKHAYVYNYPISVSGCNMTDRTELTNLKSPVYDPSTWDPHSHYRFVDNVMSLTSLSINSMSTQCFFSVVFPICVKEQLQILIYAIAGMIKTGNFIYPWLFCLYVVAI